MVIPVSWTWVLSRVRLLRLMFLFCYLAPHRLLPHAGLSFAPPLFADMVWRGAGCRHHLPGPLLSDLFHPSLERCLGAIGGLGIFPIPLSLGLGCDDDSGAGVGFLRPQPLALEPMVASPAHPA